MRYIGLAAVAFVLVSCSGDGEQGNSAALAGQASEQASAGDTGRPTDPCSLISTAEVSEAIGEEIVAARPVEGGCRFETADAQASAVTIELDQADAAGRMDIARKVAGTMGDLGAQAAREGGAAGQDVNAMLSESGAAPKLGDESFFGANSQLNVRKGFNYLAVQPPTMRSRLREGNPMLSAEEKEKMAIRVADRALGRL